MAHEVEVLLAIVAMTLTLPVVEYPRSLMFLLSRLNSFSGGEMLSSGVQNSGSHCFGYMANLASTSGVELKDAMVQSFAMPGPPGYSGSGHSQRYFGSSGLNK